MKCKYKSPRLEVLHAVPTSIIAATTYTTPEASYGFTDGKSPFSSQGFSIGWNTKETISAGDEDWYSKGYSFGDVWED